MSCSRSGSGHGSVIALAAFHAGEIDAREQHDQVRGADLNAWFVVLRCRETEAASFESFDPGITMPSFLWRYTNSVRSFFSESISRRAPLLSCGTALGNDQLGMPGADPGVLPGRQLSQTANLVFVGPDDQMLSRRRPTRVDPPLLDPVVDLLRDDAEFSVPGRESTIRPSRRGRRGTALRRAPGHASTSRSVHSLKHAATARGDETFVVELWPRFVRAGEPSRWSCLIRSVRRRKSLSWV